MKIYQERSYVLALAEAVQDCMSLDSIPYIGMYAKGMPDFVSGE